MKSFPLQLPDEIAADADRLVREGRFRSIDDLAQRALVDYIRRQRLDLMERQQLEDIRWSLSNDAEPGT